MVEKINPAEEAKDEAHDAKAEGVEVDVKTDTDSIMDVLKELTKQIAELTKVINSMKQTHDKWVRAGKF